MKKRKFTTILVLSTFLIALILSFGYFKFDLFESENLENNNNISNPIATIDSVNITWPEISTNELSKSIIDYDGTVDLNKFESIFIYEFENSYKELPNECYTYDFEINSENNKIFVNVNSNTRMIEDKLINNPTHTYCYELKVN